jgi:hypothetical protein
MITKENILRFLNEYNIEYIEYGPNVGRENINISCPLCGNDPSFHMGINTKTGVFGCWRNMSHHGADLGWMLSKIIHKRPDLINQKLGLRISLEQDDLKNALKILSKDSIDDLIENLKPPKEKKLEMPENFIPLYKESRYVKPAISYLEKRGFSDVFNMAKYYNLHYAYYGDWNYRIIFPVYINGSLVTWVGRSIHPKSVLRYMDLEEKNSLVYCKGCLYDYDNLLKGGETLYITEGVIDALKINLCRKGIRSTCLFTKRITESQIELLFNLVNGKLFKNYVILFDDDATNDALNLSDILRPYLKPNVGMLYNYSDPGEIPQLSVYEELTYGKKAIDRAYEKDTQRKN